MPSAPAVPVNYEHSLNFAALLSHHALSLVLTTYQAGRVLTIGTTPTPDGGPQLQIGFAHFPQAMGLARTPTGLAVGSRDAIWTLPASREIAPRLKPENSHDIAFLARSSHHSGPIMGHDLAWCGDQLWGVNTLFNCLCTFEAPWSFVPRWHPPFISAITPGDRCHLNGLAVAENGTSPAYVTALGSSDEENGWREHKRQGGCLIDLASGELLLRGLSMPHSPRLHNGQLYLLDSGHGQLLRVDPRTGSPTTICELPGFTRGLECFGDLALVGLSRIRETAVFGGLPLQERNEQLRCGVAIVQLSTGNRIAHLWFNSGVEEIFAIACLPGYRNPALIGPDPSTDASQTVWMVPATASSNTTQANNTQQPRPG
ncbi:TIGR03032 family protein [Synechococcus sp. ATX 2A4]|nr:TIGR03032 family protein [Synechococcus sp. ATX 2A4]